MKNIDLDSIFHHSDHSQKGHGLTLTNVYRSYKNSPHNVDATYGKYLVHRLENADKYESASPEEKNKMDIDFLDHHQKGSAAEKNGHMTADHLESFMLNPDTPKLAKQLLNHKKQLSDFIQKEHPEHIVNIDGEPHLRLTRGLSVDRAGRGADHALASYADIPDTGFGTHMHHQLVPLKNVWFAYDYGPIEATSEKFGNENEFLISPHQNIYNEEHTANPTKPIAVRNHHSLKANDFRFKSFNKKMSQQEVDDFVQNKPSAAAEYLKDHPLLNADHIQTIAEKNPFEAAVYLKNHHLFNANHIQTIVQNRPSAAAAEYLKDHPLLNANHIQTIAENDPSAAAKYLKDHPLLNANHIQTIVENRPSAAAYYLKDHPLFNANHIQTIAEKDPETAAIFLSEHPLFNKQHIDTIVQKDPQTAAKNLNNHKYLNESHIDSIVQDDPWVAKIYLENHPIYQAKYGNKVQKSLQKSTKISKQLSDKVRQLLNSKAVLNKTRGTLKFPKILPKDTRPEENVKQIPKDEPEHEMYGGLYTVKPAKQQFMESALTEVPQNYRYKEAQNIQDEMQGGLRGVYTPKTKRAFAFEPNFAFKGHEAIHAMVDKAAAHFGVDQKQVYEHLNSLIHPEDKEILSHTLKANGYPVHTHHSEMVPWIHTILHYNPAREHFFESLKFYKNNVDEAKQRQAVQRLGRTWNAIVKMGKELERLP